MKLAPPSHQLRKILLLGPPDVEKFSKKLLPSINLPPPLETTLRFPAIPNLLKIALKSKCSCECVSIRSGGKRAQWQAGEGGTGPAYRTDISGEVRLQRF